MTITNETARARTLEVIMGAKKVGARRESDISRGGDHKSGRLAAIFTYGLGHSEIHASLSTGWVFFYGPTTQSGGAPCLLHEGYDPALAALVHERAGEIRRVP